MGLRYLGFSCASSHRTQKYLTLCHRQANTATVPEYKGERVLQLGIPKRTNRAMRFFCASYCCAFFGGSGGEASACRVPLVPVCKPCHLPPPRFAAGRGLTATRGGSHA